MGVTIYKRAAKCKDCASLKYYYNGKRKLHKCIKKNIGQTLNDSAGKCIDSKLFEWNPSAMPDRLINLENHD